MGKFHIGKPFRNPGQAMGQMFRHPGSAIAHAAGRIGNAVPLLLWVQP